MTKGTTPRDKSWSGEVNYVKTESINPESGDIFVTANTSIEEHEGYLKRSQLKAGDVLFSIVGTLGRVGVVKDIDLPANTNQQIGIIRLSDADEKFVFNALKTPRIASFIKSDATIGAQPSLSLWQINVLEIKLPNHEEQTKIGKFFDDMDDLITLHQRKLDLLKQLKQAYLQKMFLKNGEDRPELRFTDFEEAWEQRKFEDVFLFPVSTNSLSRAQLNYKGGKIRNIHYGDVLIKYEEIIDAEQDSIPYVNDGLLSNYENNLLVDGDLVFADAAEDYTVGKACEIRNIDQQSVVSGLHTIVVRPQKESASFYWGYYLNSSAYHKQLLRLIQGTKVSSISKRNLFETKVCFPKEYKEQENIGILFKSIGNTITLHQNKLDQLKKLKSAFLQKMFI
ncbi:restriction endonuclease subunit S [Enterococcus pseudoavium]